MVFSARASAPPASAASNPPPRTRLAAPVSFAARPLGVNRPSSTVKGHRRYALAAFSAGRPTAERYNNAAAASRVVSGSGPRPRSPRRVRASPSRRSGRDRARRGAREALTRALPTRGVDEDPPRARRASRRRPSGRRRVAPAPTRFEAYCASSTSANASPVTDVAAANPPRRGEGLPVAHRRRDSRAGRVRGGTSRDRRGGRRTNSGRSRGRSRRRRRGRLFGPLGTRRGVRARRRDAPPKTPNEVGGGRKARVRARFHRVRRRRVRRGGKGSRRRGIVGLVVVTISPREYASTSANVTRRRLDGVAPNGSGVVSPGAGTNARAAPNAPSPGDVVDRDAPAWRERARRAGGWARRRSRGRRGASSSSGPTAASSEASKSKGSASSERRSQGRGRPRGRPGGRGRRRRRPRRAPRRRRAGPDPAPPRRVTLRVGAGAGDGAGSGGAGFLRAHGNLGLPPALAPALVYLGQETPWRPPARWRGGRRPGDFKLEDETPHGTRRPTRRAAGP